MFSENCMFNRKCKNKDTERCSRYCYPFVMLHGQNGTSGFWTATGIPAKYRDCLIENLPIKEDNPKAYSIAEKYVANVSAYVEKKGVGLFLFSVPSRDNAFGTGTGKTTTAITLLNEYVLDSVKHHLQKKKELKHNPALFVKASEFQNKYNAQFRGSIDSQQQASDMFYRFKNRMKKVELLVVDDIAIRDTTEAFKNELFEIVDYRVTEGLATIYTSNHPLPVVKQLLGDRIASRIEGGCVQVAFTGKDHRRGGLF